MKLSHTTTIAIRSAVLLAAASIQWSAAAANGATWRCGNTYSDQPCKDGRVVEVNDTRDASQQRDADADTRKARTAADRMEGDRRKLEAMGARNRPILIENSPTRDGERSAATDKDSTTKLRKGKKEVLYTSMHGASAAPEKKTRKAKKKPGD